ncbi:MAG TPA: hypothetical protein VN663_09630 [Ramlibacter sp.]|nr:hypothetical protein [Ramlibacter sp.]
MDLYSAVGVRIAQRIRPCADRGQSHSKVAEARCSMDLSAHPGNPRGGSTRERAPALGAMDTRPMRNVLINALLAFHNQNLTVARASILE